MFQQASAQRWVWNWALEDRINKYKTGVKAPTAYDQAKNLVILKRQEETKWLQEYFGHSYKLTLGELDRAFKRFFEHTFNFPKFKSKKHSKLSFGMMENVRIWDNAITVPKVGRVKMIQSRPIEGRTKGARFKRDACGDWWVTITTEFEIDDSPLDPPTNAVGIDLGLESLIATSNGEKVAPLKAYRKAEQRLKREQRKLSRKKKGSKNREKQRSKFARAHRKVARQRADHLHKLSHSLVKQYDFVAVEDLNIKGLARTKLAKSITDAGWGELVRQLEYKCLWNRKQFVKIDRFAPTSKTCSVCGVKQEKMPLSVRTWECDCGAIHDRDINAAKNILALGLKAAGHVVTACDQPSGQPTTTLGGVSVRLEALAAESSSR